MLRKIVGFYQKLPKEVRVFFEYILPAAILTALIDYMATFEFNNVYVAGVVNLVLIFLRQIKPRYERLVK